MAITPLRNKTLHMKIENNVARINWAEKVTEDIYEVGVFFVRGPLEGGSQTWFVRAVIGEGFIPIECSMYVTPETKILRLQQLANSIE